MREKKLVYLCPRTKNDEKHRTVKGYVWLARAITHPWMVFHYHEGSHAQTVATSFFKDFKGALQVDG